MLPKHKEYSDSEHNSWLLEIQIINLTTEIWKCGKCLKSVILTIYKKIIIITRVKKTFFFYLK